MSGETVRGLAELHSSPDPSAHLLGLVFLRELSSHETLSRPPAHAVWDDVANTADPELGSTLDAACRACEAQFGESLDGFFDRIAFAGVEPATLRRAVDAVARGPSHDEGPLSRLAFVYQQTRSLSTHQWQGAFFTPLEVAKLQALLAGVGPGRWLLDPAVGGGALLIAALDLVRERYGHEAGEYMKLLGVERDPRTAAIARASLVLVGAHPDQFWIGTGNAIAQPLIGRDRRTGRLKTLDLDLGIANPPWGTNVLRTLARDTADGPLVVPERVLYHAPDRAA